MKVKRIEEKNENGHPSEHFLIFSDVDGFYGRVDKIPVNIGHETATYRLSGQINVDGNLLKAVNFSGRQNFCSGNELPFTSNGGANNLLNRETWLNKENLYIIASKNDSFDGSIYYVGGFKVTTETEVRRFLENGANGLNYEGIATIGSIKNTKNSDGGEGLR